MLKVLKATYWLQNSQMTTRVYSDSWITYLPRPHGGKDNLGSIAAEGEANGNPGSSHSCTGGAEAQGDTEVSIAEAADLARRRDIRNNCFDGDQGELLGLDVQIICG